MKKIDETEKESKNLDDFFKNTEHSEMNFILVPDKDNPFVNKANDIVFDEFIGNSIIKIGYNEFYFNNPNNNSFLLNYKCNIIIRDKFMFVYGHNMPVTSGLIINYGSSYPLDFLKMVSTGEYLKNKIILPNIKLEHNIPSDSYNILVKLLQAFYRAFINEKIILDPIIY